MNQSIDRHAVVSRHDPVIREVEPFGCLSVGNGEFTFTVDVTGLQTFDSYYYKHGIPLETKAHWAWHCFPNPANYTTQDALDPWDSAHGRSVAYATGMRNRDAHDWLRANPHRFPLAKLSFQLTRGDGEIIKPDEVKKIHQQLNLWTGLIGSRFEIGGKPVQVQTVCHPTRDLVAVRVESPLIASGRLKVVLHFPYVHDGQIKNGPHIIWNQPGAHMTRILRQTSNRTDFQRTLDDTIYYTSIAWSQACALDNTGKHQYVLRGDEIGSMELACQFSPATITDVLPDFDETAAASRRQWEAFWSCGAMIDFGECNDPRAKELERRTVLSLYLTRLQFAGSVPPEETGLTCNSWHGKHNTEMVVMHLAHFALWNRIDLLEKGLDWYLLILPAARQRAKEQGFSGARWPKMTGLEGDESPGEQAVMVWQQPHPIYLAELCYRANPNQRTLDKYKDMVLETAQYMADFAVWNEARKQYVLGPPLWAAHEVYADRGNNQNPTFELAYWSWGLQMGQIWCGRLDMRRNTQWDYV